MALLERHMMKVGEVMFDVRPDSEWIGVQLGKEKTEVKFMDLWAMVFAASGPEQQERMMPVRQTEVTHFTKVHAVALKRDMKKGEVMKVRCHTDVPTTVVQGLKGMIQDEAAKSKTTISGIKIL